MSKSPLERIKVIFAALLLFIVAMGGLGFLIYLFDGDYGSAEEVFGVSYSYGRNEGTASYSPIMLGLFAIAGAYLLSAANVIHPSAQTDGTDKKAKPSMNNPIKTEKCASQKCPQCGLTNPATALKCDCGFEFDICNR